MHFYNTPYLVRQVINRNALIALPDQKTALDNAAHLYSDQANPLWRTLTHDAMGQ